MLKKDVKVTAEYAVSTNQSVAKTFLNVFIERSYVYNIPGKVLLNVDQKHKYQGSAHVISKLWCIFKKNI